MALVPSTQEILPVRMVKISKEDFKNLKENNYLYRDVSAKDLIAIISNTLSERYTMRKMKNPFASTDDLRIGRAIVETDVDIRDLISEGYSYVSETPGEKSVKEKLLSDVFEQYIRIPWLEKQEETITGTMVDNFAMYKGSADIYELNLGDFNNAFDSLIAKINELMAKNKEESMKISNIEAIEAAFGNFANEVNNQGNVYEEAEDKTVAKTSFESGIKETKETLMNSLSDFELKEKIAGADYTDSKQKQNIFGLIQGHIAEIKEELDNSPSVHNIKILLKIAVEIKEDTANNLAGTWEKIDNMYREIVRLFADNYAVDIPPGQDNGYDSFKQQYDSEIEKLKRKQSDLLKIIKDYRNLGTGGGASREYIQGRLDTIKGEMETKLREINKFYETFSKVMSDFVDTTALLERNMPLVKNIANIRSSIDSHVRNIIGVITETVSKLEFLKNRSSDEFIPKLENALKGLRERGTTFAFEMGTRNTRILNQYESARTKTTDIISILKGQEKKAKKESKDLIKSGIILSHGAAPGAAAPVSFASVSVGGALFDGNLADYFQRGKVGGNITKQFNGTHYMHLKKIDKVIARYETKYPDVELRVVSYNTPGDGNSCFFFSIFQTFTAGIIDEDNLIPFVQKARETVFKFGEYMIRNMDPGDVQLIISRFDLVDAFKKYVIGKIHENVLSDVPSFISSFNDLETAIGNREEMDFNFELIRSLDRDLITRITSDGEEAPAERVSDQIMNMILDNYSRADIIEHINNNYIARDTDDNLARKYQVVMGNAALNLLTLQGDTAPTVYQIVEIAENGGLLPENTGTDAYYDTDIGNLRIIVNQILSAVNLFYTYVKTRKMTGAGNIEYVHHMKKVFIDTESTTDPHEQTKEFLIGVLYSHFMRSQYIESTSTVRMLYMLIYELSTIIPNSSNLDPDVSDLANIKLDYYGIDTCVDIHRIYSQKPFAIMYLSNQESVDLYHMQPLGIEVNPDDHDLVEVFTYIWENAGYVLYIAGTNDHFDDIMFVYQNNVAMHIPMTSVLNYRLMFTYLTAVIEHGGQTAYYLLPKVFDRIIGSHVLGNLKTIQVDTRNKLMQITSSLREIIDEPDIKTKHALEIALSKRFVSTVANTLHALEPIKVIVP